MSIADTKCEFGGEGGRVVLIDGVLTPDSARFWAADVYEPGKPQPSFDKQFVRDYLNSIGWNKKPPAPELPVYRMLAVGYTGRSGAGDVDLVDLLVERYSKVIAYDYAYTFRRRALKDLRVYLGMARLRNRVEEAQSRKMLDNVDRLMVEIEAEHTKALAKVRDANAVIEQLMQLERNMRTSLPGSIRGMLDLSSLMRGGVSRN